MTFHHPSVWLLLLLALLPLLWWRTRRAGARPAVVFSSIEPLRAAGSSWAVRGRFLVPALRFAALAILVACVARPQKLDEHMRIVTEGIAIQLVVDRSGSMLAMDFEKAGQRMNRLDAVKRVVEDFVIGDGDLPGRPNDLIGLIAFATYADSVCPLTLDHAFLVDAVRQTAVSPSEDDRATALGDAIALGVERIQSLEARERSADAPDDDGGAAPRGDRAGPQRIRSRIMIVLTDGESNAGDFEPRAAAEMAAALGIKVYTIGAGTRSGIAEVPVLDPFSGRTIMAKQPVSIDEETLRAIAHATGGRYFRATDADSLRDVYAAIDALERSDVESPSFVDAAEMSVQSVRLGPVTVPPLLAVAFVLLIVEALLAHTRLQTLP